MLLSTQRGRWISFYIALNANDQDSLNSAAGGNFLDKMTVNALKNYRGVKIQDVAALTTEVSELKNLMKTMLIDKQKAQAPATVKAVEQSCVTCGGALSLNNCSATDATFIKDHNSSSCGNGAHIGYNCPPKVLIISKQCNQTINELPQTLPSVHPTYNYKDENSFNYDSKPNSFNDSPSVLTHPPQLQFETYLCELCGNNAHYGYDCPPQFPLFPINYPPQETSREILQAQEDLMETIQAFLKEYYHIPPNEKCMALLLDGE
ncbi:hypothetical protein Tco_0152334 [Tanacetum coccineum]